MAKYLAKNCSNEEAKEVKNWLAEDINNMQALKEFEKIWNLSPDFEGEGESFDVEMDWAVLQNRIDEESGYSRKLKTKKLHRLESSNWFVFAKVAAIFVVAMLIGVYSSQFLVTEEAEMVPILKEITMAKGQRGSLTLSDGTKVSLNSESKISLPSVFKSDVREVYLEGEAYFDVAKNPNKPFIIYTKGTIVEVLGTSFSIRSFPEDGVVRTVVEEGVVSFRGDSESNDNGVILTAGKLGTFDLNNKSVTTEEPENLDLYLGWKNGYLAFQNSSMDNVKLALERKYDIQVEFNSTEIKELQLTAEFKSRMLKNVLETISMSLDLQYEIDDDVVYFSTKQL
ncbi:MAG: FecR domain-containing protein [Balneolaceae bacterium]